jgi:hypothetical protein
VTNEPRTGPDLQEITTTNRTARELLAELSIENPTQSAIWQSIETALSDVPALATEVSRLRADLAKARLDRANLAAAARATIAAHAEGEPDPLSYLRDELAAQGFTSDRRNV